MKCYKSFSVGLLLCLAFTTTLQAKNDRFKTSHFSGSGNCSQCHNNLSDIQGKDVSIVRDWGASMMANAASDPFWKAMVASELERNPHLSSVIKDKCTQCHAPAANYEITKVQGGEIEVLGSNGILNSNHAMNNAALNGVTCTVCHQITDDETLGTDKGFSGQYRINDTKTIYGQYADIFSNPMVNRTGYKPTHSDHISTSEVCATCHELTTPYVDAKGNVMTTTPDTEFPEQTPYTEWQNSIFSDTGSNPRSCQECHMPQTTAKVSSRPHWLGSKEGFSKHHFAGANTTMLTMLRDNATKLGVTSDNMDMGIARARNMLKSAVTLEIVSASVKDGFLETKVRLVNNSGHKTPTSFPSRRMWLNFRVTDSDNNVVFESGKLNDDGSIEGADNDINQSKIEPHYDLITSDDQVQIYEAIMGNTDGQTTYTLLRAARYLKDNRLTPKGFNKMSVPYKVAVWGGALDDNNFNSGVDEITYRIPASVNGNLHIEVDLNYQTIMHGFVHDLYKNANLPEVKAFKTMYDAQSLKHETIQHVQTLVTNNDAPVDLIAHPTVSIKATPVTIEQGQTSIISWSTTNAESCNASGSWGGSKDTAGQKAVTPQETSSYTMTCYGNEDNASATVIIPVKEAPQGISPSEDRRPHRGGWRWRHQ